MNMNMLLSLFGRMTQEECRQWGNYLLDLADRPRDANWTAMVRQADEALKASSPGQINLADVIAERRKRVAAASAG